MQSRSDDVKALRRTLSEAKTNLYLGGELNRPLFSELLDSLFEVGKNKIYELTPYVYELLNSSDRDVREMAVTTLGLSTRLHLSEFKDVAYKIWLEDKDDIVKGAALHAWTSYYGNTKDVAVLKILYEILMNENIAIEHRRDAMQAIFYVAGEMPKFYDPFQDRHLYVLNSHEEFNQKVDWCEIKAIMKKCAPDAIS